MGVAQHKCSDSKAFPGHADGICRANGKDNKGGGGYNWLWSDKIETRKSPQHWQALVPDASECQAAGTWPPKKCENSDDYCMSRVKNFEGHGFLHGPNLAQSDFDKEARDHW